MITSPPDLEIRVLLQQGTRTPYKLMYELHGPGYHHREIAGPELYVSLHQFGETFTRQIEELQRGFDVEGRELLLKEAREELISLGQSFYRQLFPPEMKAEYRRFRKHVHTLQITSDEPAIPWEMVKPFDKEVEPPIDDEFFCLRFQLTRWLGGSTGPAESFLVDRLACISGAHGSEAPLPETDRERALLAGLASRHTGVEDISPGSATFDKVVTLLEKGDAKILHFVSHGDFSSEQPDEAKIVLKDRPLRPRHLSGDIETRIHRNRPLVFLNACRVARQGWSLTGLGGWADAWVRTCGCGAFLGPQWPVRDSLAYEFARAFYQELEEGRTLGEASQAARRNVYELEPGRPTSLAYVVYGYPNARIHLGKDGATAEPSPKPAGSIAVPTSTGRSASRVLATVQTVAERVRRNLDPVTLQRISRPDVHKRYLPILRKSLEQRKSRIVVILGAAGYGKSTLLGEVYDTLRMEGVPWITLIDCGELTLAAGEDLDVTMGKAAAGSAEPITQIAAELTREYGAGVVMIDTLDLVLHPALVPHLQRVLSGLGDVQATVVFTCRDHDYDMVLGPRDRLKQIRDRIERFLVPPFQEGEIVQAAQAFVDHKVGEIGSRSGTTFAQKILRLSADSRPLRQITESPLLLAMLCELFLEEQEVPQDLTVSQLYERYWKEKVVNSRIFGPETPELVEKPKLCIQIAEKLFERSEEHLQESIPEVDLDLAGASRAAARMDLLSEGVLKSHLQDSLRFFHQTFLEFTMARWLTTWSGASAREKIFAAVGRQRVADAPLHWWPVVRQFLVMAAEPDYRRVLESLERDSPAAFRTIGLAAAIRSDRLLLLDLLEHALHLGDEHQRYLCFAVENAPSLDPEVAWTIVLAILKDGQRKGCLAAVQTTVALLGIADKRLAKRLRAALDVIDSRTTRDKNVEARAEIQGQLFQGLLDLLSERGSIENEVLDLLEERYLSLTERIRGEVVRLFVKAPLPDERRIQFLESLLRHPGMGEVGEEVIELFLCRLRFQGAATKERAEEQIEVLQAPVSQDWNGFYAAAVGRLYGEQHSFIEALLQDFFSPHPQARYRDLMALDEVLRRGGSNLVCQPLLALSWEHFTPNSMRELGEVVRGISAHSDNAIRQAVAQWLRPLVQRWPDETLSLYSAVADASDSAWELLTATLDKLMAAGQTKPLKRAVLAVRPEVVHRLAPQIERFAQLDSGNSAYKQMLVELYTASTQSSEAILRLRDLSLDKEREIAVMAAHSLVAASGQGRFCTIAELLPLLESPLPLIRENFFDVLIKIQSSKAEEISTDTLRELAQAAGRDTHPAVVQRFCKLFQEEIRRGAELTLDVVEVVADFAKDLKRGKQLGKNVASALLRAYKLIAQREVVEFEPLLEKGMLQLLEAIDTNMVSNGETETINLISALVRVDPGILARLVEHGPLFKPRNIRPVAIAIRRTEGKNSSLLTQILSAEWCPQDTRSLILDMQGI